MKNNFKPKHNKHVNMITSVNEFKQYLQTQKINELSENSIELMFHLNSPYKWGKGWTASIEAKDLLNMEAMQICNNLNLNSDIGQYGVVEGKPKNNDNNIIKAYMHAMEFVFTLNEYNEETINNIKKAVKTGLSNLNEHFPISIKDITLNNKGEYTDINESNDNKIKALLVDVFKNASHKIDTTARGFTYYNDNAKLVFDNVSSPFTVDEGEDYLVLKEKHVGDKKYLYAVPKSVLDTKEWSMFGGNFIYTSDSRFPSQYPIPVHDRVERT